MKKRLLYITIAFLFAAGTLTGCAQEVHAPSSEISAAFAASIDSSEDIPVLSETPNSLCLIPTADGTAEIHNDTVSIDYSNASAGYVMVKYFGSCPKVKLRIIGPDSVIYTYDLHKTGYETFPLSAGNGSYEMIVYEHIIGNNYAACLYHQMDIALENEFGPFLYPNQYVNFTPSSAATAKAAELANNTSSDLEVINNIYNYTISSITYDYAKAAAPPTGYLPDIDEILSSGTGICLDYASLMTGMLRSRHIPTRLEIGYAQNNYHAWLSIYTEETGWLDDIIEFKGDCWTLVDPTFAAGTKRNILKKFINNDHNYVPQRMY